MTEIVGFRKSRILFPEMIVFINLPRTMKRIVIIIIKECQGLATQKKSTVITIIIIKRDKRKHIISRLTLNSEQPRTIVITISFR